LSRAHHLLGERRKLLGLLGQRLDLLAKNENRLETRCTGDLETIVADLTKVRGCQRGVSFWRSGTAPG